jgi:hypothetical protein
VIFEGEYSNGKPDGMIRQYNDNGKMIFDGEYKNDKRNGKGREYNDNGKMIFDGEYKNDKRNGDGIEFNDTGEVIFLGKYENGKRNGEGRVYNSNRQVIFHGEYHENLPYRGEKYTYNSEGRLIKIEKIENKEVLQQNNDINNENKINLESQNENKGLGKK